MVNGESDLDALLRHLSPRLNDGRFVYAQVQGDLPPGIAPIVTVREPEGLTVVIPQHEADDCGLAYDFVAAWITLEVHSALDAVGLTAAVSQALSVAGISANVVAGFTHDHIFVPYNSAARAMRALQDLAVEDR
ncbi:ACT domain-containing protein [Frigoribacterium sp. CG_9.8]|uniref:ACT domain-containing protein n=1 Tax=Frigoribacterium sp. CG_9.8 TaxID=2787733 RepID=UPI0018C9D32B|nr:ACT domain-containing protein [Frigoribacterium sp. CG_9.8]MBG6106655.1 hypothetical protein [Frigoribacterium sp. CG_9.8]